MPSNSSSADRSGPVPGFVGDADEPDIPGWEPDDSEVRTPRRRRARPTPASKSASAAARIRYRDEPVRTFFLGLGQLMVTVGTVLLLFVVYELYITDLFGAQKQESTKSAMEQRWAAAAPLPADTSTSGPTSTGPSTPPTASSSGLPTEEEPAPRVRRYATVAGQGFANVYIPALGADYSYTIIEGTTADDLYGGPGHYDGTQYPGELGNFAVAGHRVSKGSPFNGLGTLSSCDAIVIETQDDWFVYRVLPMADEVASWNPSSRPECAAVAPLTGEYAGVEGREIVSPADYAQVLPIPHVNATGPDAVAAATERLITLTTCHPQFSARERMIIHGELTATYAKKDGFLPPELGES